ncbi:MAG: hypothetical protein ABIQ32_13290 [Sphingomicrobium sp.]
MLKLTKNRHHESVLTRTLALLGVAMLVLSSGPAQGQDIGHVIEEFKRAKIDPDKTEDPVALQQLIYDYGACLIRSKRRPAEGFLKTYPFSSEAAKASPKVTVDDCVDDGEMRFAAEAVRGPMYQALYKTDFGRAAVTGLRDAPPVDYSAGAQRPAGDVHLAVRSFADCVVRKDESSTRKLILSRIGSSEEASAIQSLVPLMNGCVEKGNQIRFTRPLLRALFAETSYRLSVARSAQLAGTGSQH